MHIGDLIGKTDYLAFQSGRMTAGAVVQDSVSCLPGKVQAIAIFLQDLHHTDALPIVGKAFWMNRIKSVFSGMAKRRMP